ncbi:tRNA (adenosine(37)-N6)-threonylcarbamoyltransferase complex transferase subunit TsaD [Patescibacteria group bacterium]|nr:tRNA (adenosine(37)-N6)-threonylcarbamoyltransferase complex transferase subunit TsaD [Patescibacteria group bacterium]MBU4022835.1 tRNA (adenosine(37)-N6)-threonylcarbamoyltransferase complex transferase subunit TsaD [Patescibacteria group bacterium]
MKILAIETSCDDTCIAVAQCQGSNFELLSNIVSSQIEVHKEFGGVYPSLARREHQKNLTTVLEQALKKAKLLKKEKSKSFRIQEILSREEILSKLLDSFLKNYKKPDIDLIAVTKGPGLDPCLWTGVNFAKALSFAWNLPIIGINHIEAHILASFLEKTGSNNKLSIINQSKIFPAISLIVSGGHTQIILMKKFGNYEIVGETRDDAAGEAFDKIARILGLGYPGGPAIQKEAEKICRNIEMSKYRVKLPRPMLYTKDYDFSFSGLKTAVLYDAKKRKKQTQSYISAMAKEAQQAIIDILIKKTIKAAKDYKVKTIILGGGVSANKELQKQFKEKIKKENLDFEFQIPKIKFCGDNAAMIAITAYLKKNLKPVKINTLAAEPNIRL